jgi:hypothetical protein
VIYLYSEHGSMIAYLNFGSRTLNLLLKGCPRPPHPSPQRLQVEHLLQLVKMQGLLIQVIEAYCCKLFSIFHKKILSQLTINLIFMDFVATSSAGPARSRLALQMDQRSLHFSVNAWVKILR